MNLDKDKIIESTIKAAKKAVDTVNPLNSPVNKAMEHVHDSAMAAIEQVAETESPKTGSVEVKQGEGIEQVVKGGIQSALGGVKVFAEAAAKGVKANNKFAEAARDLVKGDTESAKSKLMESRDSLLDAAKHATIGQAENQAQAAERVFKGAKQLGKEIMGLEQVQTDWAYERPANNNGWFMSDAA